MTSQDDLEAKLGLARRHIASGNLGEARKINASILFEYPQHSGALIQRSRIESIAGNYRLARASTLQAYDAGVQGQRDSLNLLRRLRTFGLAPEIHGAISALSPSLLEKSEVVDLVATLLNSFNEPEKSLPYLENGLANDPESIPLQLSKAQTLMFLGRIEEAEQFLLECLRKKPGLAFAWWMLARLRKQTPASNHVDALKNELPQAMHPQDIAFLGYALHKELDDLGQIEEASKALDTANRSMRGLVEYSGIKERDFFNQLKALPVDGVPPATTAAEGSLTPIFIVGMHRSGTSLLEQFLDGHPRIHCAGELYDFTIQMRLAANHHCRREIDPEIVRRAPGLDFEEIGKGYLSAVDWRRTAESHITDKLPSNFLNIGFIVRALPQAKIIHMVRDPVETCFSNLREFFSETTCLYSYDQTELAEYYKEYAALMAHWHNAFPGRILDVDYKDLIQDPEGSLRRITAFCELDYVPAMLDTSDRSRSVSTASAIQVRSKPALPPKPKWSSYRDYLTPLIERLSGAGLL